MPGFKKALWFSRPAHHGDQSSTRDPDAGVRTQWGTGVFFKVNCKKFIWGDEVLTWRCLCVYVSQGYQVSLKSTRGPIDVFLFPDDSPGVCSPVTGCSPSKPNKDPALVPSPTKSTDQSQPRTSSAAVEVALSSPASTSSTVTAASQQDASSLVLGCDTGECLHSELNRTFPPVCSAHRRLPDITVVESLSGCWAIIFLHQAVFSSLL